MYRNSHTKRALVKATGVMALIALTAFATVPAHAQSRGFKVGEGSIHPRLGVEVQYDTNVNRASKDNPKVEPTGDLGLNIKPGVLFNIPSHYVKFLLNLGAGYTRYFGLSEPDTKNFSNFSGQALMDLAILPNGPFTLILNDTFTRSDNPANNSLNQRFGSFYNRAGLMMDIKPGGGALSFQIGGAHQFTKFDSKNKADYLDFHTVGASAMMKYKFFPRTAFLLVTDFNAPLYDETASFSYYDTDTNKTETFKYGTPRVYIFKAQVGLIGQFTPSFSLAVKAGYGDTFSALDGSGQRYQSGIGSLDIIYYITQTIMFQIGYLRSADFTPIYGFIDKNEPYLMFDAILADRYNFGLKTYFTINSYGQISDDIAKRKDAAAMFQPAPNDRRRDFSLRTNLPVSIAILHWLFADANIGVEWRKSNMDNYSYINASFMGGIRAEY